MCNFTDDRWPGTPARNPDAVSKLHDTPVTKVKIDGPIEILDIMPPTVPEVVKAWDRFIHDSIVRITGLPEVKFMDRIRNMTAETVEAELRLKNSDAGQQSKE